MPRQKPWYLPTAEANFECCNSNIYNNSDYDNNNSNDFIIKSIKIKMANQRFLTAQIVLVIKKEKQNDNKQTEKPRKK